MSVARPAFSDGFNSLAHFVFGFVSNQHPIITPMFVYYQIFISPKTNALCDLFEFFIGKLVSDVLQ